MASRQELRNNLLASLGLGPNMRRSAMDPLGASSPNVMDPFGISSPSMQGYNFRRGVMPSETEINRYLDSLAPYKKPKFGPSPVSAMQRKAGFGRQDKLGRDRQAAQLAEESGATPGSSLFNQLVESYKSKIDEANAANEKRYAEMHGELTDLRTRNQDRVGNWGIAAQADIDERMQTALGNQRAELAARGLQNSSILPAFEGQVAQRTAREQQRVSEMRDERASEYDTRDTNNLVGAVERREDVAPDYNNLIQLAMKYGESGQGQGMAALQGQIEGLKQQLASGGRRRYQPMNQLPMMPGPVGGAPVFLNTADFFGFGGQRQVPQAAPVQQQQAQPVDADYYYDDGSQGLTPVQSRVMRERQAKVKRVASRKGVEARAASEANAMAAGSLAAEVAAMRGGAQLPLPHNTPIHPGRPAVKPMPVHVKPVHPGRPSMATQQRTPPQARPLTFLEFLNAPRPF